MKKLYYVAKKHLEDTPFDGVETTTGLKTITVYHLDVKSSELKQLCEIEAKNECFSEEEICTYMENNHSEEDDYDLIEL